MQPIPDTRGGVSGFLAYLLWQVYRHFPLAGTWDWLVDAGRDHWRMAV
jgi:hypothetical protein